MEELSRKSCPFSFKAEGDDGVLEAVVSVFGVVDSYGDIVRPGFFSESLARKAPKAVWMHDFGRPIAKTLAARELLPGDPLLPENLKQFGGLYIKGLFFPEIDESWQAWLKIKHGLVDEFSFGYKVHEQVTNSEGNNELIKGDLYEWSPVLVGANRLTQPISIKADLSSLPAGASLDEHTEILVNRWTKAAEDRDSKGSLTPEFFNRLNTAAESLAEVAKRFEPRNGANPLDGREQLTFEAICHKARMRLICG